MNPDGGLLRLFNKRYGFQFQSNRAGYHRFAWYKEGRLIMNLPFEVPFDRVADRAKVCKMLGLSASELETAEKDVSFFGVRCLQFVLIVTQAHRCLVQSPLKFQDALRREADLLLQEFSSIANPEDCSLLAGTKAKCTDLAANPDWSHIGKRALQIVNRGQV